LKAAPNLEMLRLVFEYPSFQTFDPNIGISDVTLRSIADNCPLLSILAISRTNSMTASGFSAVLEACSVETLDFHRYFCLFM
jgi:hypothetical protein